MTRYMTRTVSSEGHASAHSLALLQTTLTLLPNRTSTRVPAVTPIQPCASVPTIVRLPAPYLGRIAVHGVLVGDVASPSSTHDSHFDDLSSTPPECSTHLRFVELPHYVRVAPTTNDRSSRGLHDVEPIDKPVSRHWWWPDKLFTASSPFSHVGQTTGELQMTL
ncbi:hypothetical protein EAI_13860 [Harpegnathos saltator]|uniref:Uncharacterized protein n=1 Tax=Harpegnathos saltator TaxID=610380 RepID=E2BUE4_HARSA|nr:hypothetical protein EAI_13860 [Harpegnathos saltator]